MASVFLVHSNADKPLVRRVNRYLKACGHETWLDEEQLIPGRSIPSGLAEGLSRAQYIVVFLSRSLSKSGWGGAEIAISLMLKYSHDDSVGIIPIHLDRTPIPVELSHLSAVDLTDTGARGFERAMARLHQAISCDCVQRTPTRRQTFVGLLFRRALATATMMIAALSLTGREEIATAAREHYISTTEAYALHRRLSSQIINSLQKDDGSIRVVADDPNWKSQAWTTAQALLGILSGPPTVVREYKDGIVAGAKFIDSVRNPVDGGWQKYHSEPNRPSVIEPAAWAVMVYSNMSRDDGGWTHQERRWARAMAKHALDVVLDFENGHTGGFWTTRLGPKSYVYSSSLALHAMLEARRLGVVELSAIDDVISRTTSWISFKARLTGGRCRFLSGQTNRDIADEPIGLTAQALYSLALAQRNGESSHAVECRRAYARELLLAGELDYGSESLTMLSGGRSYTKTVRMLWYPWSLRWVEVELTLRQPVIPHRKVVDLRTRLLQREQLAVLIESFKRESTWRLAETLMALGDFAQQQSLCAN